MMATLRGLCSTHRHFMGHGDGADWTYLLVNDDLIWFDAGMVLAGAGLWSFPRKLNR